MAEKTIKDIEELADRLDAFAGGDVLEARRDALHGQHPEQKDYETWADLMKQGASALRQLLEERRWREIETAPRDGTEILCWREDCDVFVARWSCAVMFMTDSEIEESGMSDDDLHEMDWFYADFIHGGRLDEAPTLWQPFPAVEPVTEKQDG